MMLAARAELTATHHHLLRRAAGRGVDWERLPALAEEQGIGPLVYTHARAAGVDLPPPALLALQGLYLRHRRAAGIRTHVLGQIVAACRAHEIPVLVLKGAALAHLVYPQPGLRPMRDLDLLVRPADLERARRVLGELGWIGPDLHSTVRNASHSPQAFALSGLPDDHHHLTALHRTVDGLRVSVELHHALLANPRRGEPAGLDDVIGRALAFELPAEDGPIVAHTLGREDMMWHVYRHGLNAPLDYEPFRLVWIADVVSLVEAWVDEIDWALVRRRYRRVWNALPMFHFLTPWSDRVLDRLALDVRRTPGGVGEPFRGWPALSLAASRDKGLRGTLRDTWLPSEWWTYLYYGPGGAAARLWCRCVRHPLHILSWVWRYASDRVSDLIGGKR